MKKIIGIVLFLGICILSFGKAKNVNVIDYVVIASEEVINDTPWKQVVDSLLSKHKGAILNIYKENPREVLSVLKKQMPRYVAVVEKPENIGVNYIIDLNRMSREVDDDIYADFMYGIITGYDASAALRMVKNSEKPFVIQSAVATIKELKSGKWFDSFAYVSDELLGECGEKKSGEKKVTTGKVPYLVGNVNGEEVIAWGVMVGFVDFYKNYDPDLIVTAAHATENNLEMPFSAGNIKARNGVLYADNREPINLVATNKPRVYLPIGNCLIGNVNNTKNSMAVAWMNSGGADAMIGYVVKTWYGRAGWGGLKYWLTTPGRYTVSEAFFLNQQDMLHQMNEWGKGIEKVAYKNDSTAWENLVKILKREPTKDEMGFFYDRDVLAIYGDPAWNVRLKELPEENDFTVTSEIKNGTCEITIVTKENFSAKRMAGDHFKQEHVLDLPFSYFFPERLKNPRLAKGQSWKTALDENFLLVYQPNFEPNKTYKIKLDIDK